MPLPSRVLRVSVLKKFKKKKTLIILFCSFLYAFANTSLLTKAASVPSGLSSVSMSISLILPFLKPYLNFIYLILNIPLFIIFWKKLKKSYMYLTVFFLVSNAIFGFLIGFDFGSLINGKEMSLDFFVSQNMGGLFLWIYPLHHAMVQQFP